MAFLDDVSTMQAAIYGRFGIAATWTPQNGFGVGCTVLPDNGDAVGLVSGLGRQIFSRAVFRIRVSELQQAAPDLQPAKGDQLTVGALSLTVVEQPQRKDAFQTEWTLNCEPS